MTLNAQRSVRPRVNNSAFAIRSRYRTETNPRKSLKPNKDNGHWSYGEDLRSIDNGSGSDSESIGNTILLSDSATLLCQIAFSLRPCARLHTQPMTVHSNLSTFHSYILPYRPVLKHNAYCVLYVLPTRCKTVQKLRLDYWRILRDQEVVHRTSHFCSHHHEAGRGFSMLSAIRMLIRCRLICNSNFTAEMFPDASYVVGRYMKSLFTLQLN